MRIRVELHGNEGHVIIARDDIPGLLTALNDPKFESHRIRSNAEPGHLVDGHEVELVQIVIEDTLQ